MQGMSVRSAKPRFLQIWQEMYPEQEFPKRMWAAMEVWFRLRARSQTFDVVAQAFAEKVTRVNKQKQLLEQKLHAKRLELAKQAQYIVTLQGIAKGLTEMATGQTKPIEEIRQELGAGPDQDTRRSSVADNNRTTGAQ
jgi:hypothetical protein